MWGFDRGALLISGKEIQSNLKQASSNLKSIDVLTQNGLNVYDILSRPNLVIDRDALNYAHTLLEFPTMRR